MTLHRIIDHLTGAGQQQRRNFKANSLCSLQVDYYQLEPGWLLNWPPKPYV
jgi:hypothetical protein